MYLLTAATTTAQRVTSSTPYNVGKSCERVFAIKRCSQQPTVNYYEKQLGEKYAGLQKELSLAT